MKADQKVEQRADTKGRKVAAKTAARRAGSTAASKVFQKAAPSVESSVEWMGGHSAGMRVDSLSEKTECSKAERSVGRMAERMAPRMEVLYSKQKHTQRTICYH